MSHENEVVAYNTRTNCAICGEPYFGGRQLTCSDECHDELVSRLLLKYGEFKIVVRMSTGESFKVPTRDIIEKGIREKDLDQYPHVFSSGPKTGEEI